MIKPGDNNGADSDKAAVRLALAATPPARSTEEVSTDELIALRQGTLSTADRQRVLAVLDASETSYEDWLALNRYLDDEQPATSNGRRNKYLAWGIGTAAAALLAAVLLTTSQPPSLVVLLDRSYAQALSSGAVSLSMSPLQFMGGPNSELGFTGGTGSEVRQALGSGLWAGAAQLRGEEDTSYPETLLPPGIQRASLADGPWAGTDWVGQATLGRWLVLAVAGLSATSGPARVLARAGHHRRAAAYCCRR